MVNNIKKSLFVSVTIFSIYIVLEVICFFLLKLPILEPKGIRNWRKFYEESKFYEDIDKETFYKEQRLSNTVMNFDFYRYYIPTGKFEGRYVSTDGQGFRNTVQYFKKGNLKKKVIVFFGASTMWGAGTPGDDATIPSLFSKYINEKDPEINYEVKNYGVGGYQNTQEMLLLVEKLSFEQIDFAIFFDWVSDTLMGYREMEAGINYTNFLQPSLNAGYSPMIMFLKERGVFNTTIKLGMWVRNLTGKSNIFQVVSILGDNLKARNIARAQSFILDQKGIKQAERIVRLYARNKKIIESLAATFKFRPFFIMHSNIYTKKNLSDYEKKSPFWNDARFVSFQNKVYELARREFSQDSDFFDISDSMNTSKTVFLDDHHMTRRGNDLNARALMDKIGSRIITLSRQ